MSAAALCKPRRFGDAVSDANADVHDAARLLVEAVDTLDRLGLAVITVQADRHRNKRVMVMYSPACDALDGVACMTNPDFTMWTANLHGIEIRWMRPSSAPLSR